MTPKGTSPARPRHVDPTPYRRPPDDEPDLLDDVAGALHSDEPLDLLSLVSALVSAIDRRSHVTFGPDAVDVDELPTLAGLVDTFLDVEAVETSALLAVIRALTVDEVLRARIGRELLRRDHPLPRWVDRLTDVEATGTSEMVHVLGDGDNVLVGVRLADGHHLTFVIYIDHNSGTVVKDAFVIADSLDAVRNLMRDNLDDPHTDIRPLDPADAKVRVTDAVDHGAMLYPPFETDTWPACRPLVEWAVSLLPDGGTGYEPPEWSEAQQAALADRFFASAQGRSLDDADVRGLLESVLWFGTGYGPGDPMRWSPTAVEIILLDWIPRKIVADVDYLSNAPDLLAGFIRFCHAERGIPAELTDETLAALRAYAPEYFDIIRSPRPQGPEALLAAMGVLGDDELDAIDERWERDHRRKLLTEAVGADALDELDDAALPDEAFDWTGIPDDVRDKVDEVRVECDRCCDALLDAEYRTACRRFLARVARGDAQVFRRKGRSDTAAAAVCWTIGKANELFNPARGGMTATELLAFFGLKGGISQRANTMMKAAGIDHRYGDVGLGSPDYLVSSRRAQVIERRDRWLGAD